MDLIKSIFRRTERTKFRIKNRVTVITDSDGFPISRIEGTVIPEEILGLRHMNYIEYSLYGNSYIYYSTYATVFERPEVGNNPISNDYDDITIDIILFGDIYNISDRSFVEMLMGPNGDFYGYKQDSKDFMKLLGWIYNDIRGLNVTQIKFIREQEIYRIISVEPIQSILIAYSIE